MVWVPKLFVYNSLESKEMLTPNRADVRLYYTGAVKPLNFQFCAVALASPLLNVNEMIVDATQPPKDSYFKYYYYVLTVFYGSHCLGECRVVLI
uniref:Aldedh domain-containing protein n=1 Tax=Heterorhabditis bacteriophora TaxID=37862 RepID=A0A1I7WUA4_HETBA